jgi:hypothetical protein
MLNAYWEPLTFEVPSMEAVAALYRYCAKFA